MRGQRMEKEFEKICKMDNLLTNMIIPIAIFAIGVIFRFDFLFNLRRDETPLFYKIVFIIIVWLTIQALFYLLLYLIKEVMILNKEKMTLEERIFLMKSNFDFMMTLWKSNLSIIIVIWILMYVLQKQSEDGIMLMYRIIVWTTVLSFVLAVVLYIQKYRNKISFNLTRILYYTNINKLHNILISILQALVCIILSAIVIILLLCFNNKRHIDIIYCENGLVKIYCDFEIKNDKRIKIELGNRLLSTVSQIYINDNMYSLESHFGSMSDHNSSLSIFDNVKDYFTKISPLDFYSLKIDNYFCVDLKKYVIDNEVSKRDGSNGFSIDMLIGIDKHTFIVCNQFDIRFDKFEFAKNDMHLSFLP